MTQVSLHAEILNIVFYNPENDYVVARAQVQDEPGQVTIVGNIPRLMPGEQVRLDGNWNEHPKFGRQFQFKTHSRELPASLSGIRRYLGSGQIKGLGPVMAERLISHFGEEVLDILDRSPERLLEVEGLGPKTLKGVKDSWAGQREISNLMLFLQSYGLPTTFAGRIFARYREQAEGVLRENPYRLAQEIKGIGFKTADGMALRLGFGLDSPQRLEAGLIYTLSQLAEQGHVFFPGDELVQKAAEVLGVQEIAKIGSALSGLQGRKQVVVEDLHQQSIQRAVYLRHLYNWETETASRLAALTGHPGPLSRARLAKVLPQAETHLGVCLSEEQKTAVFEACINKAFILTGGPGTGKTTITKAVVQALAALGLKLRLAAPTGRAAKRLAEATGAQATTIHRLLGFSASGHFAYNQEKKLKADVLIVDEASMLDCQLFVHLLRALPLPCRLLLIGDVNQLPPVGPGDVLADLLASNCLPKQQLNHIYRQASQSLIVVNAHRFNQGQFPVASDKGPPEADFFWVQQNDPGRVQEIILQLVCERIPKIYALDPIRDIQVLSPMHKGEVGTRQLNALLQAELNPGERGLQSGERLFRPGDRVLQTRNNYEKEVFNGDLGWVTAVDPKGQGLHVDFEGRSLKYQYLELDELSLAYAISVHKSQGSEYPAVVIPVVSQHFLLLRRNLIYTALTRAKTLAVIVGSSKALGMALGQSSGTKRRTHLKYRLQEYFGEAAGN